MSAAESKAARARIQEAYMDLADPCFQSCVFTVVKTLIDYKAFDVIPTEGDISTTELAEKIGGTEEVVERLTTFLVAANILESTGADRIAHTKRSLLYRAEEPTAALYVHMFNNVFRSFAQLPEFFGKHGFASPKSASVTPLGKANGFEDKPAYDIIVANKVVHKGFNEGLRALGSMYSLKGVYDFGWMEEALAEGGSRPAIVDVGGSHGLALKDAVRNNSFIEPERCMIYDLPEVIEATSKNAEKNGDEILQRVQMVGGSMFEPFAEKAQGALIFQFRRVFNDFPDDDVVRAFKNVRKAVRPDTRILVIEEMASPKRMPLNVVLDICLMMAAGKRRNAIRFSKLAEQAGFILNAEFQNVSSEFDDFSVLEFVVDTEKTAE